ncbi:MAG: hypothetical protein WCO13_13575 [Bacteroidota bacterium]
MKQNNVYNTITSTDIVGDEYMSERLTLQEIGDKIHYKTITSVIKWCYKNNVPIDKDGNRRFVYRFYYEKANEKMIFSSLQREYGDKWEEAYNLMKKNELYKIDSDYKPNSFHSYPRYTPKTNKAKKIYKN